MVTYQIIDRGRGPQLAGTRFTVFDILPYLSKGRQSAYIAAVCGLSLEQVEALVRYIDEHRDEIMGQEREIEARIAGGNTPEVQAKLDGARGKARALRDALRSPRQEVNGARHPE